MKIRTEARHDRILAIAAEVFLEAGFERASMSEIARRVGGSKATLYGYFASKEAMFLAVIAGQTRRVRDATEAVAESPQPGQLRQALVNVGEGLLNFLGSDIGLAAHRMVMGEAGRSDIGRLFYADGPKRGHLLMARAMQSAMDRGELHIADPEIAARHLAGLLYGEIYERWFDRELPAMTAAEAAALAERSVDVFLRAYAP